MNGGSLIVIALLFALFWLFLIRPQRRRQVEQERMLAAIEVGDEVLTAGGIYGDVIAIDGDEIRLEIAPGTQVRVARRAVAAVLTEEAADEEVDALDEPEEAPADASGERASVASEPSVRERES